MIWHLRAQKNGLMDFELSFGMEAIMKVFLACGTI